MIMSAEEIQNELNNLPNWKNDGAKAIVREYKFSNYLDGIEFVKEVAAHAENVQHHPKITIDHTRVTISFTTVDQGGVTEKDFNAAKEVERLAEDVQ